MYVFFPEEIFEGERKEKDKGVPRGHSVNFLYSGIENVDSLELRISS